MNQKKQFRYADDLKLGDLFRRLSDSEDTFEEVMGKLYYPVFSSAALVILVNRNGLPFEVEFENSYETVEYAPGRDD